MTASARGTLEAPGSPSTRAPPCTRLRPKRAHTGILVHRRDDGTLMLGEPSTVLPDGDHLPVYLSETAAGTMLMSDRGHTLMHASYEHDMDTLYSGERDALRKQIAAEAGVREREGVFDIEATPDRIAETATPVRPGTEKNLRSGLWEHPQPVKPPSPYADIELRPADVPSGAPQARTARHQQARRRRPKLTRAGDGLYTCVLGRHGGVTVRAEDGRWRAESARTDLAAPSPGARPGRLARRPGPSPRTARRDRNDRRRPSPARRSSEQTRDTTCPRRTPSAEPRSRPG